MNASLRLAGGAKLPDWMTAHLKGNRYVNTIYLCASGMLKFSGASRIPRGRKVYRGIAGVRLPDLFVLVGVDGSRGGVEFAFMSTSTKKVCAVIRGCACVPPSSASLSSASLCAHHTSIGSPSSRLHDCVSVSARQDVSVSYINMEKGLPILFEFDVVTVYPARINCNLKARTIDQIESSRRDELLAQHPYVVAEFERDVPAVEDMLSEKNGSKWEVMTMRDSGRRELEDLGKAFHEKGPANCDMFVRSFVAHLREHWS